MSFGPSQATKNATQQNAQIANTAVGNSAQQTAAGGNLLNVGQSQTGQAGGYWSNLLNGNRAETGQLLAPDIQRMRQQQQQNLQAVSTLSPRGGGRAGALFGLQTALPEQINSMFSQIRPQAAGQLGQLGLGQTGAGTNLFNSGNSALNTGSQTNQGLAQYGLQQQQATNALWSGLGAGVLGLATLPFGGGAAANGLLGLIK